jgi:hypothetical protein
MITDAVTTTNVKVLGTAPGIAMGEIYTANKSVLGTGLSMFQHSINKKINDTTPSTTQGVKKILK